MKLKDCNINPAAVSMAPFVRNEPEESWTRAIERKQISQSLFDIYRCAGYSSFDAAPSRHLALLCCLFFLSGVVHAQTLTGKWTSTVDIGGQGGNPTFILQQSDDKLTGTYTGALGQAPLHGTIKGADITFDFDAYGGTIHYVGKLSDDGKKITGTCDYGQLGKGTFTATKTEPAPAKQ